MNFTYYKFLFLDTIKRKSVWITWLLYLVTVLLFLVILPIASTLSVYQLWANTTIAICQTFLGLAASIFTAVLAINVFKNSNDEGTELIVISKPISRVKIVFTKFVMFFSFCVLVNLTAVLITAFTFFIPGLEKKFYWGLVVSMFIGNLVTFGVFGAIAVLLTIRFQKAGIIVCNVIISIVIFVYQVLSVFVFTSSIKSMLGLGDGSITTQSYVLPIRKEDGSYTEDHFVDFISTANKEDVYQMKVIDWKGVKDYWDNKNSKEHPTAVIATDIGTQLSLSYLTVNIDKYSDRQASRMYNFSRYYSYDLTKPASPEYFDPETGLSTSPLKFVYADERWYQQVGSYWLLFPNSYTFPGISSRKASYLKGTITDVLPVADLVGKELLAHYDVIFEKESWQKYKPIFDKMYENIYRWDITKDDGSYYYDYSQYSVQTLSQNFELNRAWCRTTENLNRYYKLAWACLTGHHGDSAYFGSNDPLEGYTIDDLDIKTPFDLNSRFLQFKDYVYYKIYDEQHNLMLNGVNDTQWAKEETPYTNVKTAIETALADYGVTCSGKGIGDRGFVFRANADSNSQLIQPGTQTLNNTLLRYTFYGVRSALQKAGKTWSDAEWIDSATNGSYATWLKTSYICSSSVYANEDYLFDNLDTPDRNNNWSSEQYLSRSSWIPYSWNLAAAAAETYYPFGQNLELSFYTCQSRVQFWVFAVIWGCISLAAYGASFIVYNKYDIK